LFPNLVKTAGELPGRSRNWKLPTTLGVGIIAGVQEAILRFGWPPWKTPLHNGEKQEKADSSGKRRPSERQCL